MVTILVYNIDLVIYVRSGGVEKERRNDPVRTVGVMMAITLAGKVLGLVRDRMLTVNYGSGAEANAFLTASRIPRVFFDAVFASAISACLIPVLGEVLEKRGKKEAFRFAGNFMTVMALLCGVLTVLGTVFAPQLTALFADGYDAETAALCAKLTRIMMPTVFFTGLAFSFVGILQTFDEFNIPAAISVVSNLALIVYYLTLNRKFGITGLAFAFLIAWALQAAVQIPALIKKGFRLSPSLSVKNGDMRKVGKLLFPVMVSTWVLPINEAVNANFGSRLFGGAGVSAVELAYNLYTVIAGVFVLSVTNYIFPRLARESAGGGAGAAGATLRRTLRATLFVVIPMTAGLCVMARPLVDFIYAGGEFGDFSVDITSRALRYMSLGMIGYAFQAVLSRAYFAGQSGSIPLIAGAVSVAVNAALCSLLTPVFDVAGIAAASAAAFTVNAAILAVPLRRRGLSVFDRGFFFDMAKLLLCAAVMAAAAWGLTSALSGRAGKLLTLCVGAGAGALVYAALTAAIKIPEAGMAIRSVKKLLRRG